MQFRILEGTSIYVWEAEEESSDIISELLWLILKGIF